MLHEVTPLAHAALALVPQARPAVQTTQLPPLLQTWLVPQLVPAALGLASTQAWAPVLHEVTPLRHDGLGLVPQAVPAVHDTQAPEPLQTRFEPQLVPAVLLPESLQL